MNGFNNNGGQQGFPPQQQNPQQQQFQGQQVAAPATQAGNAPAPSGMAPPQGGNWTDISGGARHPSISWGSGANKKNEPYAIQPGEELILTVINGSNFTKNSSFRGESKKVRTLRLTVKVEQAKMNSALCDGLPRSLFLADAKRTDFLLAEVRPGNIMRLGYSGKDAEGYHQIARALPSGGDLVHTGGFEMNTGQQASFFNPGNIGGGQA